MINGWLPDCGACTPKGYKKETVRYRETVMLAMASRDFLTFCSCGGSGSPLHVRHEMFKRASGPKTH
jgi:hypothetical protein